MAREKGKEKSDKGCGVRVVDNGIQFQLYTTYDLVTTCAKVGRDGQGEVGRIHTEVHARTSSLPIVLPGGFSGIPAAMVVVPQ